MNEIEIQQQNQIYPIDITNICNPMITLFGEDNIATIELLLPNILQLHIYGEIYIENGYYIRSDQRMKHDIKEIKDAIDKVVNVLPVTFKYNTEELLRSGFIAQQLQNILPELVKTEIDGRLSIDSVALIPVIIEALKEINELIESITIENGNKIKEIKSVVQQSINIMNKHNQMNHQLQYMYIWYLLLAMYHRKIHSL